MSVVFISYRRADTQQAAGRLADRLIERFGRDAVVIDVDTDQVGRDYRSLITDYLERSGIVLVLVGEGFLAEGEDGRRRIDQPNDLVRLELARALERDVPVIPVLVDGAQLPDHEELPDDIADLVFRGSVELAHQRFDRDVAFLVERIERFFDAQQQAEEEEAARREAEEAARLEAEQEARLRAEAEARQEAERVARELAAKEAARLEAEEAARLRAEAEARQEAERVARELAAEEAARLEAEEAARLRAEAEARLEAERVARELAAKEAERVARELAAKEAERVAEEEARFEKAERARREAEAAAAAARQDAEEARRRADARIARQGAVEAASGDADETARPVTGAPLSGDSSAWDWRRWGLVALAVVLIVGLAGIVVALATGGEDGPATAAAPGAATVSPTGTELQATTEPPAETLTPTTKTGAATGGFALEGTSVTVTGPQAADHESEAIQEALSAFARSQGMEITYTPEPDIAEVFLELAASDAPPDIVLLPAVNSLADAARSGWSVPVPDEVAGVVAAQWPADWTLLGAVEGTQFGVPTESGLKSLVYHKPARFDALGYDIPRTWDELRALTGQAIADGHTPWCVGIDSEPGTGWVFTDWVEDLVLRIAGAEFYDEWTIHDVPFNSPEVEAAWGEVLDVWNTPGAVYSGGTSIAEFPWSDSGFALAEDRCLMHRQANFLARPEWFPPGTTFGTHDDGIDVFYLPAMGDGGRPVLGTGMYAVALRDAPEVWPVMAYLGSAEYAEARQLAQAARVDSDISGFLSANTRQSLDVYRPVEQTMVRILWEGEPMRFDASDLMPPVVGFGSFFVEGTRAVNGEVTVVDAIDAVEGSWP